MFERASVPWRSCSSKLVQCTSIAREGSKIRIKYPGSSYRAFPYKTAVSTSAYMQHNSMLISK
jgi:hypothetical protein